MLGIRSLIPRDVGRWARRTLRPAPYSQAAHSERESGQICAREGLFSLGIEHEVVCRRAPPNSNVYLKLAFRARLSPADSAPNTNCTP